MSELPDLETLFTHPAFWGVRSATSAQRAACRIIEGLPLGELAASEDVRWMVGGEAALAALAPGGPPPKQVSLYGAVRIGKSDLAACVGFRASQLIGLELVRGHEVPRIPIVSLTADLGRVTFGHLLGRLHQPVLAPLLVREGADFVIVRYPSGAEVEICVVAGGGARAGGSLISRWVGGVVFDEKPRMMGSEDKAVVNYPDALAAVEGRLLDGAQIVDLGSPWAPWGPAWNDVQERWGKPTPHHVVMRMTGPMGNPRWWTKGRMAGLLAKNPRSHKTDGLGEFTDAESAPLPSERVDAACSRQVPRGMRAGAVIIALDGASLIVGGDTAAISVHRWLYPDPGAERAELWMHATQRGLVREDEILPDDVIAIQRATPARGPDGQILRWTATARHQQPMWQMLHTEGHASKPGQLVTMAMLADRVVELAQAWCTRTIVLDQHESAAFCQLVVDRDPNLEPRIFRWTSGSGEGSKSAAFERLRRLVVEGLIILPSHAVLRNELTRFRRVTTTQGERFEAARGETHGDHASALLTAIMADLAGMMSGSPLAAESGGVVIYHSGSGRILHED